MPETKITKAKLLSQMEDKLQKLNLMKAALQSESHIKQETLADYQRRFEALFQKGKK